MIVRYSGSRWPSVGAPSARSTRCGTGLGPGPSRIRSAGKLDFLMREVAEVVERRYGFALRSAFLTVRHAEAYTKRLSLAIRGPSRIVHSDKSAAPIIRSAVLSLAASRRGLEIRRVPCPALVCFLDFFHIHFD